MLVLLRPWSLPVQAHQFARLLLKLTEVESDRYRVVFQ
jgi:hypothetical protein